ncbi:MAG: glycerophosphodiester phosphodiesterase [Glaciihabitans sp.]|nr:glycerophosphodiester phosphodiesterase [Glaciihabitans sp.]
MTPRPLVIAHRGASGYRPEHTRAAYELAIELGADAIEPDIVATSDGILVLRHENEISGTTDVASRPEFADRRTTKVIDSAAHTGWFTEDFTWAELQTLRAIERLPKVRPESAAFDGRFGILRLTDLLEILDAAPRPVTLVAEIKHATYFASIGLPLDELFAREIRRWATADNLVIESFEQSVLERIRRLGVPGKLVYLIERCGAAEDLIAAYRSRAPSYASQLSEQGLAKLANEVDGISPNVALLRGVHGTELVARAHALGLEVFTWTLRAENKFLRRRFRAGDSHEYGDWLAAFTAVMASGVDGVFTDQPDLAIRARDAL